PPMRTHPVAVHDALPIFARRAGPAAVAGIFVAVGVKGLGPELAQLRQLGDEPGPLALFCLEGFDAVDVLVPARLHRHLVPFVAVDRKSTRLNSSHGSISY